MPTKRINVLIYAGSGATPTSIRHATFTLRRLLGPNYAVLTVTADQLLKEPWQASCALLVMPGGADMAYCRLLNGEGNRRIKAYVQGGGSYLGLCAGGYYGCAKCEFEVGKKGMEVIGERELSFYPGTCRGLAFPGFVYGSEAGARAVEVKVNGDVLGADVGEKFRSYYNGGGVFVDAAKFEDRGVEILATFTEDLAVDVGEGGAAVVFRKVGEGSVVLTGPHPEFAPQNLDPNVKSHPNYPALIDALLATDKTRNAFMRACLKKLGLEVTDEADSENPVPSLSRLHLSAFNPQDVAELMQAWHEAGVIVVEDEDGQKREMIKGENDRFVLEQVGRWNMRAVADAAANAVAETVPKSVKDALPASLSSSSTPSNSATAKSTAEGKEKEKSSSADSADRVPDYNAQSKYLVPHEDAVPDGKETPYFNHGAFYANLKSFQAKNLKEAIESEGGGCWGQTLLYGEVVTSTNTMLEKNPSWLSHIPAGFTATATTQVAGRGRGTNVWVSPPGSLMFSVVMRHSLALSNSAPVVFIQYLAALAIVAGIHGYNERGGYDKLSVKLKWPNDIYALDPNAKEADKGKRESYVKIGGILVNSSYSGGDYTLVVGIGLNVNNSRPSTSLSQLARSAGLPAFTLEKLLASILTHFEEMYARFRRTGFDARFEDLYYQSWLHTDQVVTLEAEGGQRARIKGITRDWGLLVAEEVLGWEGEGEGDRGLKMGGKRWELQSDSNSFDFFRGLVKRKT